MTHPERFAAIAPVCGGGNVIDLYITQETRGDQLRSLGVWAFHGGKDDAVNPNESKRMVEALKSYGCSDVQLTIYPEAGHDSWTEAYNNPALYEWFLKHTRVKTQ
jgi:predicted peptidase